MWARARSSASLARRWPQPGQCSAGPSSKRPGTASRWQLFRSGRCTSASPCAYRWPRKGSGRTARQRPRAQEPPRRPIRARAGASRWAQSVLERHLDREHPSRCRGWLERIRAAALRQEPSGNERTFFEFCLAARSSPPRMPQLTAARPTEQLRCSERNSASNAFSSRMRTTTCSM